MTDEVTIDQVVAGGNIVVGLLMLIVAGLLVVAAYRARAPWSMTAAAASIVLLVTATLVSSFARFFLVPNAPVVLLTLRFMALILLSAALWQLWDSRRIRGRT